MNFNEPKWCDVDSEGEFTGRKYFGRFKIKPFLSHAERADAVRLAETYYRGITQDANQRLFLTTLAFLKFHVIETDADWWSEQNGLSITDEDPIWKISDQLQLIQGDASGKKKPVEKPAEEQKES
jgi:hypothetical protein